MKNLLLLMMAILLINVSYAGEVGEDMKGDCVDSPNHTRYQQDLAEEIVNTDKGEPDEAAEQM